MPFNFPPGPRGSFLTGNMREFNRDSLAFFRRCHREYGDVVSTRFLNQIVYFVNHPDYIEYVLSVGNRNFIKAKSLRSPFFYRLVGNGLVTSEGEFWRRQRRLAQPAFHRERIAGYGRVMVDYTQAMLAGWKDGDTRDVHLEMMRLTQDIVVRTLFNADVSADAEKIGLALSSMIKPFASQATIKWILDNRLPTPGNRRFHRAVHLIDEVVLRIISERRASGEDKGDLLSMLLRAQDEDGTQMTDKQLRDEVITLFLAGYETTALTLSWVWYLLGQHPAAEAKLAQEVKEVLGGRPATVQDIPRLRYTAMVLKEAMRLYPPAYAVGREATTQCRIGEYDVLPKTQIFMFQWVVHRDARYYESPEEFLPERWTDEFASQLPKYAYFPFGGGSRICIGASFATMEATLILATIAREFKLKLAPDHKVTLLPALSLRPGSGVLATLERRLETPVNPIVPKSPTRPRVAA